MKPVGRLGFLAVLNVPFVRTILLLMIFAYLPPGGGMWVGAVLPLLGLAVRRARI